MAADSYDITIDQGADWLWTVRWLVGSIQRSATPKDITGYTAELVIAADYDADTAMLSLTTENDGAELIPAYGAFTFHATPDQTDALPTGSKLKYEVNVTSTDAVVKRLVRGLVSVSPRVVGS